MYEWLTLWSCIGPALPKEPIWVTERLHIRPRNSQEAKVDQASQSLAPNLTAPNYFWVVHYPPRDEINGSHRVQISVRAISEDDALFKAQRHFDTFSASLSLVNDGSRYFGQLLRIKRKDLNKEVSAWSEAVQITPLNKPSALDPRDLSGSISVMKLIELDDVANNSFLHLSTAWKLQSTPGSRPLERSILQHYVLSIEALINGVMKVVRSERSDEIKKNERAYMQEFLEVLPKRADKAKALREASTVLREIGLQNTIPGIETTCRIFQLNSEKCELAKELYRFRSRNLSHPGKKDDEKLKYWLNRSPETGMLCLADKTARVFFSSYCQWKTKK